MWGTGPKCSGRRTTHPRWSTFAKGVVEALGQPGYPQVLLEAPPAYAPQSNGSAENAAQQVKGMARTLMLALEARIQGGAGASPHPVVARSTDSETEVVGC